MGIRLLGLFRNIIGFGLYFTMKLVKNTESYGCIGSFDKDVKKYSPKFFGMYLLLLQRVVP